MIRVELAIEVHRAVDEVFAYVTDPARLADWQPNLVSVSKETAGPMGAGTRLREVRRGPSGRTVEALVEVAEYDVNRRFDLRIISGPLPIDGRHRFSSVDGLTRIDLVAEGRVGGALRLAEPLLALVLRRQFASYYRRLEETLAAPSGGRR